MCIIRLVFNYNTEKLFQNYSNDINVLLNDTIRYA